ncbi:DUF1499 domain-containing protein [Halopseudomonas salina]|uniref:DUF1499 domain-containing protein n=1 Tax=Halopseudomonas salina TaxID=1323744 RepID=A0ABQ1PHX2_9GAMM|nr:DUF1499 domain-containing protein [Halopseudomonas salina]GGC97562.1 hypothetical protein GCM10007418_16190 [Halopseudomonas salina]
MKILMIIALVLITLVAVAFGYIYWQNSQVPTLGHNSGQLTPLSGNPNGVSTQTDDGEKAVDPWPFKADRAATMQAIKDALAAHGGAEVVREEEDYLRVVFVTPKMRFRDDAEFYLDETTRQVHFRSESRAGKSDLGLNRQRHEQLTTLYAR